MTEEEKFIPKPAIPEREKEKLEFLKRAEIKTMAKDIADLREAEAQAEREKISGLKIEEKGIPISPPAEKKEKTTFETLIPKVPFKKTSSF